MRKRILPYKKGSKSARLLAEYLGCKRLKVTNSLFIGKTSDTIINWGSQKEVAGNARVLNKPSNVYKASNKMVAFKALQEAQVSIPSFYTSKDSLPLVGTYMARTQLSGHSGAGIVTGTVEELPECSLYTQYIHKVKEYRCIVVGSSVVDFKQKKKRASTRDEEGNVIEEERITHDEYIWNLDGGYVFARSDVNKPDGIDTLSIDAVSCLGLDFGAVDIIEDEEGKLYVLEVNTAFGLEGTTIELVGNAIASSLLGVAFEELL